METSTQKKSWSRIVDGLKSLNTGLNHDFCPGANRYVYWLKDPIGWVVCGAGFSAMVGFLLGPQGFILMWSFLALLVVGAVWPWLSMKRLECKLLFDRSRVQENGLATASIEITNKWPIPVFGLMVEGEFLLDLLDDDDRVAIGLQRIPAWSVSRFSWEFEPKQRGVLPVDEPLLTNGFPFGLYRSKRKIDVNRQTIVWPADCQLQGTPGLDGTQFNIAGMMSDRPGLDGDVIGVRQYRQGDSLKHVHWAKTATLGRLIVQERQISAQRPFEVIVDLSRDSHRGKGGQSSYEWAIRMASSICLQLHRHQAQVELTCLGLPIEFRSQSSNINGISQLLDFAAKLPHLDELREMKSEQSISHGVSSKNHAKRFFVGTKRTPTGWFPVNSERVILDCDRFDSEFESDLAPDTGSSSRSDQIPGIQISGPCQIIDELQAGWDQEICYGT